MTDEDTLQRVQRVSDLPAEEAHGQAEQTIDAPAQRLGVPVMEPDGRRIGEITDAASILEEQRARVVVGLDEDIRKEFGLQTSAVDIEARYLHREDDETVRLTEPLAHVLRQEGFSI